MGSSESKEAGARLQNATLGRTTFPQEFNIYYENLSSSLKFNLGEQKGDSWNVLTFPQGWFGDLILYSTSSTKSDPLAVITSASKMGKSDAVELAPLQPGDPTMRGQMDSISHGGWAFSAPVPGGGSERFEWRDSKSAAVRSLGESSHGWELVRLNHREEVVAVWAEKKLALSVSKAATFRWVGSGAGGQLGPIFSVMAVATFLRIWQKRMQIYMKGGIAAGAASSVGAAIAVS